jgi:hypothetical protein
VGLSVLGNVGVFVGFVGGNLRQKGNLLRALDVVLVVSLGFDQEVRLSTGSFIIM